jgi:hypothetical protein
VYEDKFPCDTPRVEEVGVPAAAPQHAAMQLSLLKRPASRRDDERLGSPSTLPGAWRDSAISQLDAIAAANDRRAATRLRTQAALFALLGLAALLISAWWPRAQRSSAVAVPASAVAPSGRGAVDEAKATAPAAPVAAVAASAPPLVHTPSAVAAIPAVAPAAATAASAASAARAADARARAAAAAAERRTRESVPARAQAAQPRETAAAIEPPPGRPSPAAAAESVARGTVRAAPEAAPRADVRSLCADSTFLAATFCQARECRKAEHQSDPACVRLREIEQARERAAVDR